MIAHASNLTCGGCGWILQRDYADTKNLVPIALWCGNKACPNHGKKFDVPEVELKERTA